MHFQDPSREALLSARQTNDYGLIFSQRGLSYDAAMRAQPQARRLEFLQLFRQAPLLADDVVLDIPSLGAYLGWYFPEVSQIIPLDFAASFQRDVRCVSPYGDWGLEQLPRPLTRVVCLAALHHVEDLNGFLINLVRQTASGVRLHLADVGLGSRISHFLDAFVGARTSTGHQGHYRDWATLSLPTGLERLDVATLPCPWTFPDRDSTAGFTRQLFGLERGDDDELLAGLAELVGLQPLADGTIQVNWELTYMDLLRS